MGFLLRFNRALDRQTLGALDHRRDDGPAGQVATIQNVPFAAPIDHFQELVFLRFRVMNPHDGLGQFGLRLGEWKGVAQINFVDALRPRQVRTSDLDFPVDPPRPENGRINQVGAVGGKNDHDILQWLQSIHLRAEHRHQSAGHAVIAAAMTGAQDGLRFVDEQEGQRAVIGAFPALDEQVPHLAFRFAHPHVQNLRPLDVQEEFRPVHTALGLDLLAQIVSGPSRVLPQPGGP